MSTQQQQHSLAGSNQNCDNEDIHVSTSESEAAPLLSNTDVLNEAIHLPKVDRFYRLFAHSKALVEKYGPYTTLPDTTIFTRASQPKNKTSSTKTLALSLAAAQDCITTTTQPSSPVKSDLLLFHSLSETAISILETILSPGSLPQETFGWGIFGLSSGYIHISSSDTTKQALFQSYKSRLHAALCSMPSLDTPRKSEYARSPTMTTTRLPALVHVRREIHTCGHILLYKFRQEGWRRVRWFHVVAVAERWIGAFGVEGLERGVGEKDGGIGEEDGK